MQMLKDFATNCFNFFFEVFIFFNHFSITCKTTKNGIHHNIIMRRVNNCI